MNFPNQLHTYTLDTLNTQSFSRVQSRFCVGGFGTDICHKKSPFKTNATFTNRTLTKSATKSHISVSDTN